MLAALDGSTESLENYGSWEDIIRGSGRVSKALDRSARGAHGTCGARANMV